PPCGVGSRTSSFTPSVRPAGLNSRNDDDLALRLEADVQPARASEEAGVERLNRVGVDRAVFRSALQQGGHTLRNPGIEPGGGDIEFAAGRTGRAKGEATELQARRRRFRAPFDEIERKSFGLLITVFFFQHLESVDDRTGGTDQIVANARTQERGEIERI